MKEFKYKGAIVRPYEPFGFYASESFFKGSIGGGVSRTVCASSPILTVMIEADEEADIV